MARTIEKTTGSDTEFSYISVDVPLFNQDLEQPAPPSSVQAINQAVLAVDGVIVVTPEYNRSVPGVLKNTLDWLSRPKGSSALQNKPMAVLGASPSPTGTEAAQGEVRTILSNSGARVMFSPQVYVGSAHEVFDETGAADEALIEQLQSFMSSFKGFIGDGAV